MEEKNLYEIKVTANEEGCKKALELLKKLIHTFKDGMTWSEESFRMEVKVNQTSSQDK